MPSLPRERAADPFGATKEELVLMYRFGLATALFAIFAALAQGRAPPGARAWLCPSRLLMLVVKAGKYRPIAIGMSLVAACGRVICHQLRSSLSSYLTTTRLEPQAN